MFSICCQTKQYHGRELDMLDVFKSAGLDEIPPRILREASEAMPELLAVIFEESWSTEINVLPLTIFSNYEGAEEAIVEPSEVNYKVSDNQYGSIKNKSYQIFCDRNCG